MNARSMTRRTFLAGAAAASAVTMTGCPLLPPDWVVIYRRSGNGLHVSNAAKRHNANHRYADALVAALDKAHPGDNSKVVSLTISRREYNRLFPQGRLDVDLRHI